METSTRKLLTFLIALGVSAGFSVGSFAQGVGGFNVGNGPFIGGPVGYQGPGDVKSGWIMFWGTRAFNSATRGSKWSISATQQEVLM
jgi:hypothetical protein